MYGLPNLQRLILSQSDTDYPFNFETRILQSKFESGYYSRAAVNGAGGVSIRKISTIKNEAKMESSRIYVL